MLSAASITSYTLIHAPTSKTEWATLGPPNIMTETMLLVLVEAGVCGVATGAASVHTTANTMC